MNNDEITEALHNIAITPKRHPFYKNWIDNEQINNEVFSSIESTDDLHYSMVLTAKLFKNLNPDKQPIVMYSGGIDSEAILKAFIDAKIRVKAVHFKWIHKGLNNTLELQHVKEFYNTYSKDFDLEIIDFEITDEMVNRCKQEKWWDIPHMWIGLGNLIIAIAFQHYATQQDIDVPLITGFGPVTSLRFERQYDNYCTVSLYLRSVRAIVDGNLSYYSFYAHFPYIFKTAVNLYKNNNLMQMYRKYPHFKFDFANMFGLALRTKSNGTDFIVHPIETSGDSVKDNDKRNLWSYFTGTDGREISKSKNRVFRPLLIDQFKSNI